VTLGHWLLCRGTLSILEEIGGEHATTQASEANAEAISVWRSLQDGKAINLGALHDWLVGEHGYEGSLRSVQRYWRRTYPAPAIRARRRVETPAGAQAQVDRAAFPGAVLGDEVVDLVALIMTLSWSRKPQQNAYVERYNRTVRHEWLDLYIFETIEEVQQIATEWLWTYNNDRSNMGIGGVTPAMKLKMAA